MDLNPYAIAIARFRLLLAALKECGITRLSDAPGFGIHLACGDSLLHGSVRTIQQMFDVADELRHVYQPEDPKHYLGCCSPAAITRLSRIRHTLRRRIGARIRRIGSDTRRAT